MSTIKFKNMKDLRINSRMQRVWVLRETDERLLYIPVKSMHRVDYNWFAENDKRVPQGSDFLNIMAKSKLKNGQNALKQYDSIIQVVTKSSDATGTRIPKPEEAEQALRTKEVTTETVQQPQQPATKPVNESVVTEPNTTDPRTLAKAGVRAVYEFRDKDGKVQRWEAKKQGPYPVALQEKLDQGLDASDFRVE